MYKLLSLLFLIAATSAIENPAYDLLFSGSSYEIRAYATNDTQYWSQTIVKDSTFSKAGSKGFHRLFDYISGENDQKKEIDVSEFRKLN